MREDTTFPKVGVGLFVIFSLLAVYLGVKASEQNSGSFYGVGAFVSGFAALSFLAWSCCSYGLEQDFRRLWSREGDEEEMDFSLPLQPLIRRDQNSGGNRDESIEENNGVTIP